MLGGPLGMIAGGLGIALLISGATNIWQASKIEGLNENLGVYKASVQMLEDTVEQQRQNNELAKQISDIIDGNQQELIVSLNKQLEDANRENQRLNAWRNQLAQRTNENPDVSARAASLASRRVFNDIERLTTQSVNDREASGNTNPE